MNRRKNPSAFPQAGMLARFIERHEAQERLTVNPKTAAIYEMCGINFEIDGNVVISADRELWGRCHPLTQIAREELEANYEWLDYERARLDLLSIKVSALEAADKKGGGR